MTDHEFSNGNVVAAPLPLTRFQTLADTYGAEIERWPEAERAAAHALLDRNQNAHDALAAAAILDRLLDSAEPPRPSDALVRELERRFEAHHAAPRWLEKLRQIPSIFPSGRPGYAFAGMAAVLVIAVLAQYRPGAETPPAPMSAASIETAQFSDGIFAEDGESLDLEIALIDQSLLEPATDAPMTDPMGLIGWTMASAPSIEEMPLE